MSELTGERIFCNFQNDLSCNGNVF